jgi:glutathione S-transferase
MATQPNTQSNTAETKKDGADWGFQRAVVQLKERHPAPSIERDGLDSSADRPVVLYHFGPSICSQKVRLTLAAKGVKSENREVNLFIDENLEPDYMRINPRGVVPTLIDDGYAVIDSAAIMRYIDHNFSGPALEPEDEGAKAVMQYWLDAQDQFPIRGLTYGNVKGIVGDLVRSHTPSRIATLKRLRDANPDLAEDYEAKLRDTDQWLEEQSDTKIIGNINAKMGSLLDRLDQQVKDKKWLVGDQFTLADIAWMTILARIDFVDLDTKMWGDGRRPFVKAYYDRLKEAPGFDEQISQYQNKLDMLKRLIGKVIHQIFGNQVGHKTLEKLGK